MQERTDHQTLSDGLVVSWGRNSIGMTVILFDPVGGNGLGSFDRETQNAVNSKTGEHADSSRYPEEHGVEFFLLEVIVLQQDSRMGIDVGPRVLGLTLLCQDVRHNGIQIGHQLE